MVSLGVVFSINAPASFIVLLSLGSVVSVIDKVYPDTKGTAVQSTTEVRFLAVRRNGDLDNYTQHIHGVLSSSELV